MKAALWFVGLFGVAVASALLVGGNQSTVTVFWAPYRVDLSLNLVLLCLLILFVVMHLAWRALSALFDLYGALLTEKQQKCLELHLFEDFSLSEIGEDLGISRQAVYDIIHRSEQAMEAYEAKLGLAARYQKERAELGQVYRAVGALRTMENGAVIDDVLTRLSPFTEKGQEV